MPKKKKGNNKAATDIKKKEEDDSWLDEAVQQAAEEAAAQATQATADVARDVSGTTTAAVADTRTEEEVLDLVLACQDGKLALVKRLATRPGVDINRGEATGGKTPMHCAALDGHVSVINYLAKERDANVNVVCALH